VVLFETRVSINNVAGFDTRVSVVEFESIVRGELRERTELLSLIDSHVVLKGELPYEEHESISFSEL
jgi:hypothetical protein